MKKVLSVLLGTSILLGMSNFNASALRTTIWLGMSKTNRQTRHAIAGVILGVDVIFIVMNEIFNKQYNLRSLFKNLSKQEEQGEGWEKVANLYLASAKQYDENSAEYNEYIAEYYRCLMYLDLKYHEQAENYYQIASDIYKKNSEKYSTDKSSYNFQINDVKSAEMLAKCEECLPCGLPQNCEHRWEQVKNKKDSYDSYANAKVMEWRASHGTTSWEDVANAWENVKNDSSLRITFHDKNWESFKAFAEANRQMCLLKCNKTTKEEAKRAWLDARDKDLECGGKVYKAFAAEAEQMANDIS